MAGQAVYGALGEGSHRAAQLASVEVSSGVCLYLHCSDKETQRILLIQRAVSLSSWAFLAWMLVSQ